MFSQIGIKEFASYFTAIATSAYQTAGGRSPQYSRDWFKEPKWQTPVAELERLLAQKYPHSAFGGLTFKKTDFIDQVTAWLHGNGINEISYYNLGSYAVVFEARPTQDQEQRIAFKIGYQSLEPNIDNFRAWSPLALQPTQSTTFKAELVRRSFELMPLVAMVRDGAPEDFDHFLNECVLEGTPYVVSENKDLGLLADGTPVFVDADCVNFRSDADARRYYNNQFRDGWQQDIMWRINENCRNHNLQHPLSWVVQKRSGCFVTQQSALDSGCVRPERQKIAEMEPKLA